MVYLKDENESFTLIKSENTELIYEIMAQLEVFMEGYKFTPQFRAGIWDGKKKFYTTQGGCLKIPKGLVPNILKHFKDKDIPFDYDRIDKFKELRITKEKFIEFTKTLNIPFEPYDYQIQAALDSINTKRLLIRAATGSGKSLIIYLIFRYLLAHDLKCVLIVPTISLTLQMKQDFIDYGWKDAEHIVHLIGGENTVKNFDKPITVSTWQSLYKNPHLFDVIDCIIIDESHKAKSDSLADIILPSSFNSSFKIGLTGTPPRNAVDKLTLLGALGPVKTYITTQGLIERGLGTPVIINTLFLNYPEEDRRIVSNFKDYQKEDAFICSHLTRNLKVSNIAKRLSEKGNVLMLFDKIAHGKMLVQNLLYYKLGKRSILVDSFTPKSIQDNIEPNINLDVYFCYNSNLDEKAKKNLMKILGDDYNIFMSKFIELEKLKIFFVHGGVSGTDREDIRNYLETDTGIIIVASFGTTSTGVNFRNLHNIILASSTKSFIRLNQTIGRGMRKHESKDKINIWDIVDDLSTKTKRSSKQNFVLKHFNERLVEYLDNEYPIREKEIVL